MKLTITNGVVTAQSESIQEAKQLFELSLKPEPEPKERKVRNVCEECGKKCKGKKGLGIHKFMAHGVVSPNHERNKEYYAMQKAKKELPF
jgi:hypothetical protein